jgi:hypothetical protein
MLAGHQGHTTNIEPIDDPREIIATYVNSVQLAKAAGFDGIELNAQGYAQPGVQVRTLRPSAP